MSLIRKHGAVLQAWACLALVVQLISFRLEKGMKFINPIYRRLVVECQRQ